MDIRDVKHLGLGVSPFDVGLALEHEGEVQVMLGPHPLPETERYLEELRSVAAVPVRLLPPDPDRVDEELILGRAGSLGTPLAAGVWGRGNGATTFLVHLAQALGAAGRKVALLDADVRHLDLLERLRLTDPPLVVGRLIVPRATDRARCLSVGAFAPGRRALPFRGDALRKLMETYRDDGVWGRPDVLLVDLPDLPDELPMLADVLGIAYLIRLLGPLEAPEDLAGVPVTVSLRSPSLEGIPKDGGLASGGLPGEEYLQAVRGVADILLSKVPKTTGTP